MTDLAKLRTRQLEDEYQRAVERYRLALSYAGALKRELRLRRNPSLRVK